MNIINIIIYSIIGILLVFSMFIPKLFKNRKDIIIDVRKGNFLNFHIYYKLNLNKPTIDLKTSDGDKKTINIIDKCVYQFNKGKIMFIKDGIPLPLEFKIKDYSKNKEPLGVLEVISDRTFYDLLNNNSVSDLAKGGRSNMLTSKNLLILGITVLAIIGTLWLMKRYGVF